MESRLKWSLSISISTLVKAWCLFLQSAPVVGFWTCILFFRIHFQMNTDTDPGTRIRVQDFICTPNLNINKKFTMSFIDFCFMFKNNELLYKKNWKPFYIPGFGSVFEIQIRIENGTFVNTDPARIRNPNPGTKVGPRTNILYWVSGIIIKNKDLGSLF